MGRGDLLIPVAVTKGGGLGVIQQGRGGFPLLLDSRENDQRQSDDAEENCKEPPETQSSTALIDWRSQPSASGHAQARSESGGGCDFSGMESSELAAVGPGGGPARSAVGGDLGGGGYRLGEDDVLYGIETWDLPPLPPPPCFD